MSRIGEKSNWALTSQVGRRWMRLVRHSFSHMRPYKSILHIAVLIGRRSSVPVGITLSSSLGHCYFAV